MDTGAFNAILILFCLGVLGLSQMLSDKKDRKFRRNMEWKARESFWRINIGLDDKTIEGLRVKFFAEHGMKPPKRRD